MKTFTRLLSIIAALSLIMLASSAYSSKQKKLVLAKSLPDSLVLTQLGNTLTDILVNPTTVTMYAVRGKEQTDRNDFVLEPHYVRDSLYGVLSPEAITILEFTLITNESNYRTDSIKVRSPYMPQFEFEFSKKKQTAHVLLSTSDFSWTVIYDGKKQFNYNYTDNGTIERFLELIKENK